MSRWMAILVVFCGLLPGAEAGGCSVLDGRRTPPEAAGLKPERVAAFLEKVRAGDSDAVVVLKNGQFVAGFGEQKPRMVYSITKAVTSLAAGGLFTQGSWKDVDAPLATLLPEFRGDPKGAVTLRQLMSHTSGIEDARDGQGRVLREWNEARDWLQVAKGRPMRETPGTVFRYNNQGPFLVGAAIERATGERLDRYARRTIFDPLCVGKTAWMTDRAGHAAGYMGLTISAFDLAKLGQLVVERGRWGGRRVLAEEWIRQSALTSSQSVEKNMGLAWFVNWQEGLPLPLVTFHTGDGGQYLLIFPNHGVVAVRLRDAAEKEAALNLKGFSQLVIDTFIEK